MSIAPTRTPEKTGLTVAMNGDVCLHGTPLQLPPKECGVLRLLLRNWPAQVSKQDFDLHLWRGGMTDEGLARAVANLRRLLTPIAGLGIRSVYGRGYQLIIEAQPSSAKQQTGTNVALLETLDYARQRMQLGSEASLAKADGLIREVMLNAPSLQEAKVAHAQCLADMVAGGRDLSPEELDRAIELLDEVGRESPDLTGIDTLKAHLLDCAWRFDEARPLHLLAVENSPENAKGHFHHGWHLIACGEIEPAMQVLERAQALAPYSLQITLLLAHASLIANDQPQFSQWVDKAHRDHPENPKAAIWRLSRDAIQSPHAGLVEQVRKITPDEQTWTFTTASLSFVLASCGADDEARQLIERHATVDSSLQALLASTYLLLNEPEEAMFVVQQAAHANCGFLPLLLRTPTLSGLHRMAEYPALQQRVFARLP
ncbi:winged helix-turn-helix domain-containing protein [Pseudomonas sp. MM211]|uniref:winged helix-turn-helix domain-containing protein n=1 Tax=Pseudomonas sp. MM211 TaxID=2866808 RepID=UPI001CED174A|nr:winged helix-turn-helix domain-containing protein [Pseudomonas sp. MM211]UCJ17100.1 winged helix-turn-helix domain-containing protein [Pseudomonas sp. MM211]